MMSWDIGEDDEDEEDEDDGMYLKSMEKKNEEQEMISTVDELGRGRR